MVSALPLYSTPRSTCKLILAPSLTHVQVNGKGMYKLSRSGLLFTHNCEHESVLDGTFAHGKKSITHALKIRNPDKNKWHVLSEVCCFAI